jgi:Bacterial Ig-like domain
MIPPTGGDRDSLPPLLLKVTPADSTLNFNKKTITFTFDEYIEDVMQQNPFTTILVSPTPDNPPEVTSKLKTMTLTLKDTLEPNTTYQIDFGDLVKDVNERNVLYNFSYIFSTGPVIDSLELTGKVMLAETGGIDTTLIVMLHRSPDDSAVAKENPRYISKLDGKGNFHFEYLPAGTFYLYALKAEGGQRTYTDSTQLFAFADSAIEIKPALSPITLYAFASERQQPQQPAATINFAGGNRGGAGRQDDRRLRFSTTLTGNMQDLLGEFNLNFDRPLRNVDTAKLLLSTDSSFIPTQASWQIDSSNKKLTLKVNWKENTLYNLILDKDFAEDTSGRKLFKTDTISFTTKKQVDYGSIKISFVNIDLTKNPVVQFLQSGSVIKTFPLTSAELYQGLFNPGDYDLSILFDENKNGKWDPGKFFGAKKQPELVRPLNKKITIRPNWDNEYEITL